jgi:hypothetical protein
VIIARVTATSASADMDEEFRHDAAWCVKVLTDKFGEGFKFRHRQVSPCNYVVECDTSDYTPQVNDMTLFAEGFLASAFLWERW